MNPTAQLEGVFNITPTPFLPDGSLDEASIARFTEFVIRKGVHGMTILGVMGEAAKVTGEERERIIATVLEAADGRIPVCVGTTHQDRARCIEYSLQAQRLGAHAVMVAPPGKSTPSDTSVRGHYLAVADAIQIPIVVQDHPASSGVQMDVEFLASLAEEVPQCRYLKMEDAPSPAKISRVLAATKHFTVFGGLGGIMFLEELRHGAKGTMTGFAFPEVLVEIFRKYRSGDPDGAREVFYRFCPLIRFENQPIINLAIRKEIYFLRGVITSPHLRPPGVTLEEGDLADLKDLLSTLNLGEEK